jgi:acyloxyacyl hydrolase
MSYAKFICVCLFAIVLIPVIDARPTALKNGVNGGVDCAVCSIVLGLVDKLTIVHNKSIEHALELLCDLLPAPYKSFCTVAVEFLGKF